MAVPFFLPVILFVILTGSTVSMADSLNLGPGLQYFDERSCDVPTSGARGEQLRLRYRELKLAADSPAKVIFRNTATVRTSSRCPANYVGETLPQIVARVEGSEGVSVLGAANGNFFYRGADGAMHSTGWIYSTGFSFAPFRIGGGDFIVLRLTGGRTKTLLLEGTGECGGAAPRGNSPGRSGCRVRVRAVVTDEGDVAALTPGRGWESPTAGLRRAVAPDQLVPRILQEYPDLVLGLQLRQSFRPTVRNVGGARELAHYSRCDIENEPDAANTWKCRPAPRTLLCLRPDHSVSIIVTRSILPYATSLGFRPGGPCEAQCSQIYNLDGGGSTQMGIKQQAGQGAETGGSRFELVQGHFSNGGHADCPTSRPVENVALFINSTSPR